MSNSTLPPVINNRSGVSFASFLTSLISAGIMTLTMFIAVVLAASGGRPSQQTFTVIGLLMLTSIGTSVASLVCGIIGSTQGTISNGGQRTTGLIVSGAVLLFSIFIMLYGMSN